MLDYPRSISKTPFSASNMPKKDSKESVQSPEKDSDGEDSHEVDKQKWDKNATQIGRMIDNNEENKDEMNEISKEALSKLQDAPEVKKICIRAEDVNLIINELETTRIFAENQLLKHDGDLRATIRALIGL